MHPRTPRVVAACLVVAGCLSTGCRGGRPGDALPAPPEPPARAAAGARVDIEKAAPVDVLAVPPDPFGAPPAVSAPASPTGVPFAPESPPSSPTYL